MAHILNKSFGKILSSMCIVYVCILCTYIYISIYLFLKYENNKNGASLPADIYIFFTIFYRYTELYFYACKLETHFKMTYKLGKSHVAFLIQIYLYNIYKPILK